MWFMTSCPNCKKEVRVPKKKWAYGRFEVQSYECGCCKTKFREYVRDGKKVFALKQVKGKRGVYAKIET